MGVRLLNRFLKEKTFNCIRQYSLEHYRGQRIVVDASIYMYRYIGDNALIENFYLMCSLFRHYDISALFVFDGVPPNEKKEELKERANLKKKAKEELKELDNKINNVSDEEKKELEIQRVEVARQCIHIKSWHIIDVKNLIESCGLMVVDAPGEADHLCAKMVKDGYAEACMSEDMDMFVHGCTRILRYMSLTRQNVVEYNLDLILRNLRLTFEEFQQLCVLSGTDYTKWIEKQSTYKDYSMNEYSYKTIFQNYQYIQKYKEETRFSPIQHKDVMNICNPTIVIVENDNDENHSHNKTHTSFFKWCYTNNIINQEKLQQLLAIQQMFDLDNYPELNDNQYLIDIKRYAINETQLRKTLSYHHFY